LKIELIKAERRLKLICYDFPKIENNDINYLRKFTLLLKILNKIIEKSFNSLDFNFSWEDILLNLLHFDNSPDLMINSMLRELKRRKSYKTQLITIVLAIFIIYAIFAKYSAKSVPVHLNIQLEERLLHSYRNLSISLLKILKA